MFLYRGAPGGGSFALVSAPGAMPPPAEGSGGLVNWHSLVLVFSYKVRPSGNCVVFHRGFRPPATGSAMAVVPSLAGGATPLSTYSVIIIIATEAVAQFTI